MDDETLIIGRYRFRSRLIVGTGKYASFEVMRAAHDASGTEVVTVAVRRVNLHDRSQQSLLGWLDTPRVTILPNTAGCYTADEAVRAARLGRAAGMSDLIKLEVIGDEKTLMPDTEALVHATARLVKEGFTVMPYTNDDVVVAKKLEAAGAACVMPLAAPIGSGQGILNPLTIRFILEAVKIPVIVDAGVGTASDASMVMELGADGVLMNTAIAGARDPVAMARAMRLAVEAGRLAYLAGRIPKKPYASASSPSEGLVTKSRFQHPGNAPPGEGAGASPARRCAGRAGTGPSASEASAAEHRSEPKSATNLGGGDVSVTGGEALGPRHRMGSKSSSSALAPEP